MHTEEDVNHDVSAKRTFQMLKQLSSSSYRLDDKSLHLDGAASTPQYNYPNKGVDDYIMQQARAYPSDIREMSRLS